MFFVYSPMNRSIFIPSTNEPMVLLPRVHVEYHMANGLFEESLIDWSKQFCSLDGCFVDIGAHTGTYTAKLARNCQKVVSFEPQQLTFYALCGTIALSSLMNVQCHNIALGSYDQVGSATLSVPSIDGGGSTILLNRNSISEETVQVRTLDSFHLENVTFNKIDVEGNEPGVLEGARETLRKNSPVILFEDNSLTFDRQKYQVLEELQYDVVPVDNYKNMFLATRLDVS
jgi:FkbM family methyltransferase